MFPAGWYWSSTQLLNDSAWAQRLSDGGQYYGSEYMDYDPGSRALEDYQIAGQELASLLQEQTDERRLSISA